ncbi:TerC family protein [Proteobacteria bacterium 005FR1]|nr:TerC family protein [Proteobacteria bacterium 005FR1]
MFELLTSPEAWIALVTLTALEVVLGIDNIIFISILVDRLPPHQRPKARTLGLGLAMITRIALLFSITWLMGLTTDVFTAFGYGISWRDVILGAGGLFLIGKSTMEIHTSLEGVEGEHHQATAAAAFGAVILQIAIIDIVFSLDSVITAVGMVDELAIMVAAVVLAVAVMMFTAGWVSRFVERHPTIKMLALSFLILIGFALVGESLELHIPKGYIYFAMFFSVAVEMLNLRMRRKQRQQPVKLRKAPTDPDVDPSDVRP